MYDVAIIGLGPAGSILARQLDRRFRVIAIDKKLPRGTAGFHKPCGGLLAPDAQKALSRFNITLPKEVLSDPQIFSVRTIDVGSGLVRHYQRHYINLDRHKFDQWLMGMIPSRVDVRHDASCTAVARDGDGFRISFIEDGERKTTRARYLVGADGAHSIVRRTLFGDFHIRSYLAIQQWFPDTHATPFYSCIFDAETTDSYAWGLSKDSAFIFGGAFAVKTGKRDFELLKEKLRLYGFRLDRPLKSEACLALRPSGPRGACCGGSGVFLAGEAAGFISPSSLEGISYAIESGFLLAQCLNRPDRDPNMAYRKGTRLIRLKLCGKNLKRPFMYHPFLRTPIMASGLTAIPVEDWDAITPCEGIDPGPGY